MSALGYLIEFSTLTMLWANSEDDKLIAFFLLFFLQEIGSDTLRKLCLKQTLCMKCQILFSRKQKNNTSKCRLLKFSPSM